MSKKALLGFESLENKKLLSVTPNDPYLNSQWGLKSISSFQAWQYGVGSRDVVVAVIDSGADLTNQDLQNNLWKNPGEIPGDGIDNEGDGYIDDIYGWNFVNNNNDVQDRYGHGSHVAGIIGAEGNNGLGIAGVNWNVSIMSLKVMSDTGIGSTSSIIQAIDYISMMKEKYHTNIVVTNASWVSLGGYSQIMNDEINKLNNDGILFVVAAGNNGSDNDINPRYPSCYNLDNVISVGALSNDGINLAELSNYGVNSVDLVAPGIMIKSTLPYNSYGDLSGTSMAAPFVAGAAALLSSVKSDLSMLQIRNAIFGGVDKIPELFGKVSTGGKLNIGASVAGVLGVPYNSNQNPIGKITGYNLKTVNGWVSDPDSANVSVAVQLVVDGLVKNTSRTRASDGAFSFNLGGLLVGTHVIEVKVMDVQTHTWSSLGSVNINIPAPLVEVSLLNSSRISGWAYSERSGTSPIMVKILVNNRLVASQLANQPRSMLMNTLGSSRHGFNIGLNRSWFHKGTNDIKILVLDPVSKQVSECWSGSLIK